MYPYWHIAELHPLAPFSSLKLGWKRKYLPSIWLFLHYPTTKYPLSSMVIPKPSREDFDLLGLCSSSLKCFPK